MRINYPISVINFNARSEIYGISNLSPFLTFKIPITKNIKDIINERNILDDEQKSYKNKNTDDFGGYGIFEKIGKNDYSSITWNNDEELLKERYQKLLDIRKNQL